MLSARELPAKQSQPGGGAVGRAARVAPGREKRIAAVCWRATAEPVGAERTASEPMVALNLGASAVFQPIELAPRYGP